MTNFWSHCKWKIERDPFTFVLTCVSYTCNFPCKLRFLTSTLYHLCSVEASFDKQNARHTILHVVTYAKGYTITLFLFSCVMKPPKNHVAKRILPVFGMDDRWRSFFAVFTNKIILTNSSLFVTENKCGRKK